jgi:hypothetical protein
MESLESVFSFNPTGPGTAIVGCSGEKPGCTSDAELDAKIRVTPRKRNTIGNDYISYPNTAIAAAGWTPVSMHHRRYMEQWESLLVAAQKCVVDLESKRQSGWDRGCFVAPFEDVSNVDQNVGDKDKGAHGLEGGPTSGMETME